jgi:PAS domain S-box-containing protein
MAFCAHTILHPDLLVVQDTSADDRFATNPLVTADPRIRFYAGMPLVTQEGYALGALCVMDHIPRELSLEQKLALKTLSLLVVKQLELRRQLAVLCRTIIERKQAERRLALQYDVARVLAETATLDEAIQKILQTICESLGWEVGAIWNVDRRANVLSCFDLWHAHTFNVTEFTAVTRETTFSSGVGLPGRVWASGKPAWITDVTKDPNFPRAPIAARVGLHGAFAFPILLGGEVTGVIEFFSREIQSPDDDLLQMMAALGSETGLFIERMRAEEALRESEMRFRSVLQSALDAVIVADSRGHIMSWNKGAQRIFGYEGEEIVGQPLTTLMPARYREAHEQGLARLRATGESRMIGKLLELHGLRKDGTEFPLELSLAVWKKGEETFYSGIIRDITERKRAEEEREKLILELQDAMTKIKVLRGLLPICASCKRIRDDTGYWKQLEDYIADRSEAQFTHGICSECSRKLYPGIWDDA